MTLRDNGSGRDVARRRDRLMREMEAEVEEATDAAMREFLRKVQRRVTPAALTAASQVPRPTQLFELGEAQGWWDDAVSRNVTSAVRSAWQAGYFDTRDGDLVRSSQAAVGDYLANVTDRLSRTATPTVPERAFDKARGALAQETARGSSIRESSRRLAAEFGWDEDATFWRDRLGDVDRQVDGYLDAIGPPGSPERETVRLRDPWVAEKQAERSEAVLHIDRVESEWQTRAERIARTESTGALNAGALDAGQVEGAGVKVWIATADDRTREDHLDASGQCVSLDGSFDVGGYDLQMPGDPSAPPGQTVNCRCTVVFADSCEEASQLYGDVDDVIDVERERREEERPEPEPEPEPPAPPEPTHREFGSGEEGARWAEDVWEAAAAEWDEADQLALSHYQGAGHRRINEGLRDVTALRPQDARMARDLDHALDVAPRVPEPVTAYRGAAGKFADEIHRGMAEWVDDGFLSTSVDFDQAAVFARQAGVVMEIRVPAGSKAAWMKSNPRAEKFGAIADEQELLVQRGAKMRVVERHPDRIVTEIVGYEPRELPRG